MSLKIKKFYLTLLIMKQTTLAHKLFCDITISFTDTYLPVFCGKKVIFASIRHLSLIPGHVAQLVTCLATDISLTADPEVASLNPARPHTFVEIDHEIISTINLLPSAESFKKCCCQLQAKICA